MVEETYSEKVLAGGGAACFLDKIGRVERGAAFGTTLMQTRAYFVDLGSAVRCDACNCSASLATSSSGYHSGGIGPSIKSAQQEKWCSFQSKRFLIREC